jgi:hypothetical protein
VKFRNNNFAKFREILFKKMGKNFARSIYVKIISKHFAKVHSFLQIQKIYFIRHHPVLLLFMSETPTAEVLCSLDMHHYAEPLHASLYGAA